LNTSLWIATVIIAILVVIGVLLIIIVRKRHLESEKKEINYRVFYYLSLILIPLGIIWIILSFVTDFSFVMGVPILGIGASYLAVALANREKWRNDKR